MKEASKKQIDYAEKIAKTLNIDLPEEKTAYAYWKFINEHKNDYKWERSRIFNETYGEEISHVYCESWFC